MSSFTTNINHPLLSELASSDSSLRNKAALEIVDHDWKEFLPHLAMAIARPSNIGANGTLVYALGHFDCREYFELLVNVAIHHGFEASQGALCILTQNDFELSGHQLSKLERDLDGVSRHPLLDFQMYAVGRIREHFCGEPSNAI